MQNRLSNEVLTTKIKVLDINDVNLISYHGPEFLDTRGGEHDRRLWVPWNK